MADNPLLGSILDPAGIQLQMARQQALYDALAQQSLTPQQGQMVSGHYIAPAFGGLGNIGKALIANKTFGNMLGERSQLSQQMAQNLQNIFGGNKTQTIQQPNPNPVPVPSTQDIMNAPNMTSAISQQAIANNTNAQNTPAPVQIQSPSNGPSFANLMKIGIAGSMLGPEAGTAVANWSKPTDASLMANQAGVDPLQANRDALTKANLIAPISMRQGAALIDPLTHKVISFSPKGPENSLPIIQDGQIVGFKEAPGGEQIMQNNAYANSAGAKGYRSTVPSSAPIVPSQAASTIQSGMPPGIPNSFGPTSEVSIKAFGQGLVQQLASLDKNWTALSDQNRTAQVTNSYLQQIKDLAKTAAVGPEADKRDFVNGLLSIAGVSDRATDKVTANDLLDKYSNQIVARLGQGGMGTDAARAILQSAYPGAHMNQGAINEAVDNLVGSNEMIKAKTSLLSPYAAKRDPIGYQNNEVIFDQNADPRLWQYKAIAGTPQGKIFLQNVLKQDPQFLQKAQALHKIGAF